MNHEWTDNYYDTMQWGNVMNFMVAIAKLQRSEKLAEIFKISHWTSISCSDSLFFYRSLWKALLLLRYSSAPNYFQLVLHCWAEFDSLPCVDTFWNSFSLPLRFKLHLRPFFSNNLIIWTGILLTDLLSRLIAAHHETTVYVMCYYSSPFYTRPHTSDSPEWKHLNMETEKERHGWRKLPVDRYAAPLLPIS